MANSGTTLLLGEKGREGGIERGKNREREVGREGRREGKRLFKTEVPCLQMLCSTALPSTLLCYSKT